VQVHGPEVPASDALTGLVRSVFLALFVRLLTETEDGRLCPVDFVSPTAAAAGTSAGEGRRFRGER